MKVLKTWEEQGAAIPAPYSRVIKVLLAPDKHGVGEITFLHAILSPHSQTDYHAHDRQELITVVAGRGIAVCEGKEIPLEPEMALWVERGEWHQVKNTGPETLKLANVFVPPYTERELLEGMRRAAEREKAAQG